MPSLTREYTPKKCETIGCRNPSTQMFQIAPGTNVWLCDKCKEQAEADIRRDKDGV